MNNFELECVETMEEVRKHIQECEGKHTQQVAYSTFHDCLTQICFGCRKIRTSIYYLLKTMNPQTINLLGKAANIATWAKELSREVEKWNEMHDEPLTEAEMKEFIHIMSSIELHISSSVREMHDRNEEKVKAITKASE